MVLALILSGLVLFVSFYVLARVVDLFFVESLEIISKKLGLSSDIAGATFMAVGSSAPELLISLLALFRASEQQALGSGTIVGSAIFNILVIIGASALFRRAVLTWQPVLRDLTFYVVSIIILLLTFMDGKITLFDAVVFVLFYIFYIFSFKLWKIIFPYTSKDDIEEEYVEINEEQIAEIRKEKFSLLTVLDKTITLAFFNLTKKPGMYIANFVISILFICILSYILVESAVVFAHTLGVPEVIIGLTILAAGTSIPDLLSSVKVAKTGRGDMAIANAVGSNIFDIAIGLGLPWLILILSTGDDIVVLTENLASSIVLLFATVIALLFLLIVKKWEIGRYAGLLLIALYILYVIVQIFSPELLA